MRREAKRIIFDFGGEIIVSPPLWSDKKLDIQPGDLSHFTPYGNGIYGYQNREKGNPFLSAPLQEPCGGAIYFGGDIAKKDFEALLRIMGVGQARDFAVFTAESEQPGEDGYLAQMRAVSRFGLRYMFDALTEVEYAGFVEQKLTMTEALCSFVAQERKRWGTSFMEDRGLGGKFGGDGHFACEELAFGFMVENHYHHVYRIWSRAWLVTK